MVKPKALVLSGYGLNCEEETAYACTLAGANATIVHINDLIERRNVLKQYQILAIPGGFSYGDDLGAGKAYASKLKNHLWDELQHFVQQDALVIGICNGFQVLTNLGLLEGALVHNDNARYTVRWVDLKVNADNPWLKNIQTISLPIAHGEGKFCATNEVISVLKKEKRIALNYYQGEICNHHNLPANPNGSILNIAAITDKTGRILGIMPHPERAIFFTQLPHWPYLKEKYKRSGKKMPKFGPGLKIFKNAVDYFRL